MNSSNLPPQDPESGLYDLGHTVTAESVGFVGAVWVTPALWQLCIWRTGTDESWPERVNELLTSLRSTYNKAAPNARGIVFTPPFGHHWESLTVTFQLGKSGEPEFLLQLLTEAKRHWPKCGAD